MFMLMRYFTPTQSIDDDFDNNIAKLLRKGEQHPPGKELFFVVIKSLPSF